MIGIPLGLLHANLTEALFHKYVLHGLGKRPGSFWAFHWHEHHRAARKNGYRDDHYQTRPLIGWHPQTKEKLAIALGVAIHLPLLPLAPFFVGTLAYCGVHFYRVHRRSHLDPDWARVELPWHYDHHMGPDQNCNWGIVRPWFDQLTGSRVVYVGTQLERRDRARRQARAAKLQADEGLVER